jgi:P4 family phage/plasmid primase-like protien
MADIKATINFSNDFEFSNLLGTDLYNISSASHCNNSISDSNSDKTNVVEFKSLEVDAIPYLNGDHLNDARHIKELSFKNSLIKLNGKLHFFNGVECTPTDDSLVRKFIADSMLNGLCKVTKGRIEGTYAVLVDQIIYCGEANPPHKKIFFSNGAYNLETKQLEQHQKENKNTRVLAAEYQQSYDCPNFKKWLESIFEHEPERIDYLQELMGWTLSRHNFGIEKAIMLIGPARAGKGVLINLLREIHGKGASSFILGNLDNDKQLSAMQGSHLSIDSDCVSPRKFDANAVMGRFKVLTSNEPTPIRLLYSQEVIDSPLNSKLLIAANSVPLMLDNSAATANRWLPLVFDKNFLGKEDPELKSKFLKEIYGITNWALEGLERLVERKRFALPQSSIEQINSMMSANGSLGDFISEELTIDKNLSCKDVDIYNRYKAWSSREGYQEESRPMVIKALEDALRQYGVKKASSVGTKNGPRGFRGIGLKKSKHLSSVSEINLPETSFKKHLKN